MNWKYLLYGVLFIIFAFFVWMLMPKAEATFHRDWSHWVPVGSWSECQPQEVKRTSDIVEEKECTVKGVQSRKYVRWCEWQLGGGSHKCSIGQTDTRYENRECEITVECEPEPTPTPTPEPCTNNCGTPPTFASSSTEPPKCGVQDVSRAVVNPHVYRKGDVAIVKWWNTAGDKAHIYYKQVDSKDWQYSVVVPNTGYAEIKGLGTMDISFAVMQVDSCSGGVSVSAHTIVDGASDGWVLFR